MTIERELKFSTDGVRRPSEHEVVSLLRGGGYHSESQGERVQRDRYFDDAVGSLAGAGFALRRRRIGAERTAALKAGGRIEGALHEREEIELPVVGTGWPDEIVTRLTEIVDPTTLRSRITLETRRERYRIERNDVPVATLSFDEVEATRPGGSHQIHFSEVEIEAIGATDGGELERIAELIAPLVTLTPNGTTKLQRAIALLELATWES